MTYKERLIELLQQSPTDAMGNHGVGAMAGHLMDNGLVFKELYEDMEERIAHQRVRAQTAEHFICSLCSECDCKEDNGIATMTLKCCSMFPECGKFKLRSGWIPFSERLPNEHDSFFARFYGTERWMPEMFRKTSDEVIVCIRYEDGTSSVKTAKTHDGKWDISSMGMAEVTHWMPLPEAPGDEGERMEANQ